MADEGGCIENISISSAVCHKPVKQNQTHVVLAVGPNRRAHTYTCAHTLALNKPAASSQLCTQEIYSKWFNMHMYKSTNAEITGKSWYLRAALTVQFTTIKVAVIPWLYKAE